MFDQLLFCYCYYFCFYYLGYGITQPHQPMYKCNFIHFTFKVMNLRQMFFFGYLFLFQYNLSHLLGYNVHQQFSKCVKSIICSTVVKRINAKPIQRCTIFHLCFSLSLILLLFFYCSLLFFLFFVSFLVCNRPHTNTLTHTHMQTQTQTLRFYFSFFFCWLMFSFFPSFFKVQLE